MGVTFPEALLIEGRITESFTRYLAVHTKQAVNGSENVYTQRAKAAWSLDYSGTVDAAGFYNPSAANALSGPAGNKFTLVSDGSTVPVTGGQGANDATKNQTWRTGNEP